VHGGVVEGKGLRIHESAHVVGEATKSGARRKWILINKTKEGGMDTDGMKIVW
jgi:hypothetical protein